MDMDALAALDDAVRTRISLFIDPADKVGRGVMKLAEAAEVPSDVLRSFAEPGVRILRRDTIPGEIAFVLLRRDSVLRVGARRPQYRFNWSLKRDGEVVREAPGWVVSKPDLLDPVAAMEAEAVQPVVHGSFVNRVWDSFIVAMTMAHYAARAGMREIIVDPQKGRCMVDPHVPLAKLGVSCLPVPDGAAAVGHLVRHLPSERPLADLRSLAESVLPTAQPDACDIFVSFELEKKRWLEQGQALADAINALIEVGRAPERIVVNGMTAPFDAPQKGSFLKVFSEIQKAEENLIDEVRNRLIRPLGIDWLYGQRFFDKAERMRRVGYFLAPGGSASLIANVMGIPGVSYGNSDRLRWVLWPDGQQTLRLPADMVEDRFEAEATGLKRGRRKVVEPMRSVGYSIDPGAFAQFVRAHADQTDALTPRH